jgi:hypothetical protein
MNLTNEEWNKVIEALENVTSHPAQFPGRPKQYAMARANNALAILQAAKDRQQPKPVAWMSATSHTGLSVTANTKAHLDASSSSHPFTIPLYAHPPQPAVDKLIEAGDAREWLLSRGMWPEQLSSRINLGDTAQAPTILELFTEFAAKSGGSIDPVDADPAASDEITISGGLYAFLMGMAPLDGKWFGSEPSFWWRKVLRKSHKSAAPVDAPKMLTDEVIERLRITREREEGRPASSKYGYGFRDGLRYARDKGYLAPVAEPKVSQDEYDRMSFVMRGGVTPIPAKLFNG